MSSKSKHQQLRKKATKAEQIFIRKVEETRAGIDLMNQGKNKTQTTTSDEELEKMRRKLQRMKLLEQQSLQKTDESNMGSLENNVFSQNALSGGNIHNNINVAINYTVHQQNEKSVEGRGRKKQTLKGKALVGRKQSAQELRSQREKELMNTSLSQMLDRQLLMGSQKDEDKLFKNRKRNPGQGGNTMTFKQFHGDKIYLDNGAMAFKPLGVETILETVDEQGFGVRRKTTSNNHRVVRGQNNIVPTTTESNIAMQQRLGNASAEDLFQMPRAQALDLAVKQDDEQMLQEDHQPLSYSELRKIQNQQLGPRMRVSLSNPSSALARNKTIQYNSSSEKQLKPAMNKSPSKSSLKYATNNQYQGNSVKQLDESRMVHRGLQQYQQQKVRMKRSSQNSNSSGHMLPNTVHQNEDSEEEHYQLQQKKLIKGLAKKKINNQKPSKGLRYATNVQFIENPLDSIDSVSDTAAQGVTGGNSALVLQQSIDVEDQQDQSPLGRINVVKKNNVVADKIGNKMMRQKTGNSRSISRQIRDMRYDDENSSDREGSENEQDLNNQSDQEIIKMDTVIENPMPAMPDRMRSNKTFQPESKTNPMGQHSQRSMASKLNQKAQGQTKIEQKDEAKLSQLAIDYNMHIQNQNKIQSLMLLLGKRDAGQSHQFGDLNLGESMSNLDAVSVAANQNNNISTKLPDIKVSARRDTQQELATQVATSMQDRDQDLVKIQNSSSRLIDGKRNSDASMMEETSQFEEIAGSGISKTLDYKSATSDETKQLASRDILKKTKLKNNYKSSLVNIKNSTQYNKNMDQDYNIRQNLTNQVNRKYIKTQLGRKSHIAKLRMMRSSMFQMNPVIDRIDTTNAASENQSQLSTGRQSNYTRHQYGTQTSLGAYHQQKSPSTGHQTIQHHPRSISSRKLQPLAQIKSEYMRGDATINQKQFNTNDRAQSLQFNKGLSYVMIKGKIQPSEKYIFKNMMPYTNAQQFSTVKIQATQNRQTLILQQNNTSHHIPTTTQPGAAVGNQKLKASKKLKGSKMRRKGANEHLNSIYNHTSATGTTKNQRKGVIMEMEEEYSGEEDDRLNNTQGVSVQQYDKNATWQDFMNENMELKEQIQNQIAIFEQYLKVAILQQKVAQKEAEDNERRQGLKRNASVEDIQVLKEGRDYEYDERDALEKLYQSSLRKNAKSISKKPNATLVNRQSAERAKPMRQSAKRSRKNADQIEIFIPEQSDSRTRIGLQQIKTPKASRSVQRSRSRQKGWQKFPRQNSNSRTITNLMISSSNSVGSSKSNHNRPTPMQKAVFVNMSRKITTSKKMALEHLQPFQGYKHTHTSTHTAHQHWMSKIERLWDYLNKNRNSDVVRIQDEIKKNKVHIQQLTRDNMFELDVNYHDQKVLINAYQIKTKVDKRLRILNEEKKIHRIQKHIRTEIDRKANFDTWGFNNHIISYQMKVRMTEDIIDCAQRLMVKADAKTQRELDILKHLRDRTYEDLRQFIILRDKKPWRVWDAYGVNEKPGQEEYVDMNFRETNERVEIHLQMLSYLEPRFILLLKEIPPYNSLNSEMIQFCTQVFGNEGWLQLFQIKLLRRQQDREQHDKQYMPPVDQIKKLEVDPYTLQIENDEEDANKEPETDQDVKRKLVWDQRKPKKRTQATLNTGYESIKLKQTFAERERNPSIIDEEAMEISQDQDIDPNQDSKASEVEGGIRTSKLLLLEEQKSSSGTPKGFGVNKFEGDVVSFLQDQVKDQDIQDEKLAEMRIVKKSNWLQTLAKEKQELQEREAAERKARAARLAILFDDQQNTHHAYFDDDDKDEVLMDAGAAKQDALDYLEKIDTHLKVEKRLMEAWQDKDKK